MNWSGTISKPTRSDAPPSPASTTSGPRSNHQCCPCSATLKKFDLSSTSLLSNTPHECLHTYVLINNLPAEQLNRCPIATKCPRCLKPILVNRQREEPDNQRKPAAFTWWHKPDDARVTRPDL